MVRKSLLAMVVTACSSAAVLAADFTGKITTYDSATRKLTLHVDDKDQTLVLAKDCKFYKFKGSLKKGGYDDDPNGIKDVVAGAVITLSTDFVDGDEVVTILKIKSLPKKK